MVQFHVAAENENVTRRSRIHCDLCFVLSFPIGIGISSGFDQPSILQALSGFLLWLDHLPANFARCDYW